MPLGGGSFSAQNKVLPGAYINFVSRARAVANLSDRGIVTMPLILDWGKDEEVFEVTNTDFKDYCLKIFGYDYTHEKMKGLRDLFLNARKLYAYKLNKGTKASNKYATAKYTGSRGNSLKTTVQANVEDATAFDVITYLDNTLVDTQTVKSASELVSNDYVTFKSDATLTAETGIAFTGGADGEVTGKNYQDYFDKIESYSFNTMGITTTDDSIKTLAVNFCKRMRDEIGAKFQLVLHKKAADYEGVINLVNNTTSELVYFITGIEAGCAVNKTCLNKVYDGEYDVNTSYTQAELEEALKNGKLVLHKVGDEVRILKDINSLVTLNDTKNEEFKENQTIRVIDQIANDIASLFNNKYLGNIPNDAAGRVSLWNDIVKHHKDLQNIRAITNFNSEDVVVEPGTGKGTITIQDKITIVNTMTQLYMTVTVD